MATAVVRHFSGDAPRGSSATTDRRKILLSVVAAGLVAWVAAIIVDVFQPSFQWYVFCSWLDFQAPHIATYIVYFCLGIAAFRQHWFQLDRPLGPAWIWAVVSGVLSVPMIWVYEHSFFGLVSRICG